MMLVASPKMLSTPATATLPSAPFAMASADERRTDAGAGWSAPQLVP